MFFDEARAPFLPVERGAGFVMTICGLFVLLFVLLPAPLVDAALVAARALHAPPGQ
jgi:NADH-quinone oxidoreductase subunit N